MHTYSGTRMCVCYVRMLTHTYTTHTYSGTRTCAAHCAHTNTHVHTYFGTRTYVRVLSRTRGVAHIECHTELHTQSHIESITKSHTYIVARLSTIPEIRYN